MSFTTVAMSSSMPLSAVKVVEYPGSWTSGQHKSTKEKVEMPHFRLKMGLYSAHCWSLLRVLRPATLNQFPKRVRKDLPVTLSRSRPMWTMSLYDFHYDHEVAPA
jgi:hypothetical protein